MAAFGSYMGVEQKRVGTSDGGRKMRLSKSDFLSLTRAADAVDAQRDLMAMAKARAEGRTTANLAAPLVIAVALSAAVAVFSIAEFIPQQEPTFTYLSQASTRSSVAGG